jgi:methionine salvage enolase-phosphatase E1
MRNKKLQANAEKQKRYRERQKAMGKKMVRGYITPEAMDNYNEIVEKTNWTDSDILSNALRITYAAYKNGQIRPLNKWLEQDDRKKQALKARQQHIQNSQKGKETQEGSE